MRARFARAGRKEARRRTECTCIGQYGLLIDKDANAFSELRTREQTKERVEVYLGSTYKLICGGIGLASFSIFFIIFFTFKRNLTVPISFE